MTIENVGGGVACCSCCSAARVRDIFARGGSANSWQLHERIASVALSNGARKGSTLSWPSCLGRVGGHQTFLIARVQVGCMRA